MTAIPIAAARRRLPVVAALAFLALASLAFALGRWSAAGTSPGRAPRPAHTRPAAAVRPASASEGWGTPLAAALPAAAAPAVVAPAVPPELVAAVTAEAAARFEPQRQAMASACWPAGGLSSGHASARLRVNVTFDRDGREIARGIQEDRRARSGELTQCLRSLGWNRLSVTPPGTNVGVTFPVQFP